jgi:hypothetical protein
LRSVDVEKAFGKTQYSFIIKISEKSRNRKIRLNIIRQTYTQHHANWGKTEIIPFKVRDEKRVTTLPTPIQYSFGIPSQRTKSRERNKRDSSKGGISQIIPIHR